METVVINAFCDKAFESKKCDCKESKNGMASSATAVLDGTGKKITVTAKVVAPAAIITAGKTKVAKAGSANAVADAFGTELQKAVETALDPATAGTPDWMKSFLNGSKSWIGKQNLTVKKPTTFVYKAPTASPLGATSAATASLVNTWFALSFSGLLVSFAAFI